METEKIKKLQAARILSEANDLKRTIPALAKDIDMDISYLREIVRGNAPLKKMYGVIKKMGKRYSIDVSDLFIFEDDCANGVKIMRAQTSEKTARIFNRNNSSGEKTPYYEYRDTAMSRAAPFKPEWIKELRVVDNSDPYNSEVVYNNGHFMHQLTFFIGPVNFYWEINGKKFCSEMNTGDSNYITPYWPHSFASRDKNKTALILAVTFGGDARRAQKEIYLLGNRAHEYVFDSRNPNKAVVQLIKQHMQNENLTPRSLQEIFDTLSINVDVGRLLDETQQKTPEEIQAIAKISHIDPSNLYVHLYNKEEEVVVKRTCDQDVRFYPNKDAPLYTLYPLARTSKLPFMKGFAIEITTQQNPMNYPLNNSLHAWIYNYGVTPAIFYWMEGGEQFQETLYPGDSVYIQPFIMYGFSNFEDGHAKLCSIGVFGSIHGATQRELSSFSDIKKIIEYECWFD